VFAVVAGHQSYPRQPRQKEEEEEDQEEEEEAGKLHWAGVEAAMRGADMAALRHPTSSGEGGVAEGR